MVYFEYSVNVNGKLFANFHDLKEAKGLSKTLKGMNENDRVEIIENNQYPTIHGSGKIIHEEKASSKGWHEPPDHTGKAPCHKDAALRAEARGACNKPMKKADHQENRGHQSNVRYRGYQIDYTLRKERGMNRYEGNMIIYSDDLKFIIRSTLSYLPDNSIQHVFKQADEILKRNNMGDATFVDEESRKQNIKATESYKTKRSPRAWKKIGEFRYERARDGLVVGIEEMPTGGYMAFEQMPNRPPFDLYDVNNGEEWIHKEDLEKELKDWMKGAS